MQSSAVLSVDGSALSLPGALEGDWYTADLPATVLGTLAEAGQVRDPYSRDGFLALPGLGAVDENLSNEPMPDSSPFRVPWWFRRSFEIPGGAGEHVSLQLDGINYRANVWLNGRLIAPATEIAGSYREHELDVTDLVDRDRPNVLAIEVFPPEPCDVALSWVDWNPTPPDRAMGIWRDVWLRSSGPVSVRAAHVVTRLDGHELAYLTVAADLINHTGAPADAVFRAYVDGVCVSAAVSLSAGERRRVELRPAQHPELVLRNPRLWWPRPMAGAALGEPSKPELYDAAVSVEVAGTESDAAEFRFGVREVTCLTTARGHALFHVNGEPVQIRGAGWACDMLLRRDPDRDRAQLEYVAAMHLNTIRFEGMLERDELLDWCDENGVMVIAGWCCCDCWEKWDTWKAENHVVATESLRSQIRRARRHPCMIAWWYGSDDAPPPHVERRYLEVLGEECWPNPVHSSASHRPAALTGASGLKMHGPYDYVPPNYWLEDTERGGAFGFATEISAGPAVPPIESLRRMLGDDHLWPIDDVWRLHCGGKEFHNLEVFTDALLARYGDCSGVDELAELSQLMTYETTRAMFEAYRRNRYRATGVIQWMLNNAWPSLIWHLFDYYLRPGGGFFGAQKACEPVHVMYSYNDGSVVLINDQRESLSGVHVRVRVLDPSMRELLTQSRTVDVAGGGNAIAFIVPPPTEPAQIYFIDLRAETVDGTTLSRNFYWLPPRLDVLDHEAASWTHTPIAQYADFSALRELPTTILTARARHRSGGLDVDLWNATERPAFFVQLRAADATDRDILPVVWTDNYVTVLPGEMRTVRATFPNDPLAAAEAHIEARGLNVPRALVVPLDEAQPGLRSA